MSRDAGAGQLLGDYEIDPAHTRIGFAVRHAMVTTVRGKFLEISGAARFEAAEAASVSITIWTSSITTGQQQRDDHLRSPDFFDAETYPEMLFRSTAVEQLGHSLQVSGNLTIRAVTRPITLDLQHMGVATDPFGDRRTGFEGRATLSRGDFGLTYNVLLESGGVLVGDEVTLEFDISAIHRTPAVALS